MDARAETRLLPRRFILYGGLSCGLLAVLGCSRGDEGRKTGADKAAPGPSGGTATARPARQIPMTVYRDPNCGCCEAWARLAGEAGYAVGLVNHADMPGVKQRLGVPDELASCHTAEVAGFIVEGHVPFEAVGRLLRARPTGIRGIGVPGMPRGSPGMEMPDGARDPFEVIAFTASGSTLLFRG